MHRVDACDLYRAPLHDGVLLGSGGGPEVGRVVPHVYFDLLVPDERLGLLRLRLEHGALRVPEVASNGRRDDCSGNEAPDSPIHLVPTPAGSAVNSGGPGLPPTPRRVLLWCYLLLTAGRTRRRWPLPGGFSA